VFDLSLTKIAVLLVLAVVIFGPDQLPKVAAQAGRTLRELRRLADGARRDLQEGLGPEFGDFDIADLNPRTFVRKHLLDEFEADPVVPDPGADPYTDDGAPYADDAVPHSSAVLAPGESPPYDSEAT
jgi:sec-independent protein translocase protein TatB